MRSATAVFPAEREFNDRGRAANPCKVPGIKGNQVSIIESRLRALGLSLPPPTRPPPGVVLPFQFVHVVGRRALISGHGPQAPDGSFALPLGKLGRELTVEQGYVAARLTALSILASLQRALGDLDRIAAWSRVFGMVNSAPGFNQQPSVINGLFRSYSRSVRANHRSALPQCGRPRRTAVQYSC